MTNQPLRVIEGTAKPFEPFWVIRDAAGSQSGETEIEFDGVISEYSWFGDEITPAMFKAELYEKGHGLPITVLLNSPGGDVTAASVIRSTMQEYPGRVTVDIVGMAASAATIVMTGADTIRMRESALIMIHDPWTIAVGNSSDLKTAMNMLDAVKASIVDAYQTKTGMEPDKLARMMANETWMTAREAKDLGFVDEVVTGSIRKASALSAGFVNCLKNYANVPADLLASETETPVTDEREAQSLRDYVSVFG